MRGVDRVAFPALQLAAVLRGKNMSAHAAKRFSKCVSGVSGGGFAGLMT